MTTCTSGIYRIYCISDDREYIGRSVHIERRWTEHRKKLLAGNHRNPIMQWSWNKYGEASFKFEIVEILEKDKLQQREQELLDELFACGKPFNLRRDACGGADHTPEAIKKMSIRRSQANAEMWEERKKAGWKMSDEERAKRSAALKEYWKRKREESVL